MDVHALFAKLIWLDWVVLLVVLGSVVQGLRRGFVRALLDLLGSLLAVVLALAVMPQATAWVLRYLPLTLIQGELLALFGVVIVARLVWALVLGLGFGSADLPVVGPGALLSALGGAAAGLAQGLVIAALALVPFAATPVLPEVTTAIGYSVLAPSLVGWSVVSETYVDALAGHPGVGPLPQPHANGTA